MTARPRFVVTFTPAPGVDGVKAVRRLLKHAGRYLGLRALDAREEITPDTQVSPSFATDVAKASSAHSAASRPKRT
jgi:hypothetical protein